MKAVVYNKKALPDKLMYCDVEKPMPNDNEVLIKIHTVSANAADYRSMRMGIIPKRRIFRADVAGRVESVGKNIRQFKPGDEVVGDLADYGGACHDLLRYSSRDDRIERYSLAVQMIIPDFL